ncbi:MAG: phosphatidylglycerophosphatase A [Thiotrichales bacterium]|jgi:phosphatidylglycerophosphatase A|nr:phosphatidylglycerophosphatase A [Thiotrichales bacterium]MBT3613389.1 phosphatidylglycerophosphatase A [Thiotrichales bacterium]MBT3752488.1 phosphatidylglycerophosphatase A [Thiotrichales bacterium]MBT3837447.1 phosphatidylglycerophosphatase A [Thiotrichales bacterium]MBT4151430.1 phosphatidylglycerophosphatase A [Thiotrichales bacterium]
MKVSAQTIFSSPTHLFAFGFGSGLAPIAPGTAGTLAAIPIYLLIEGLSLPLYLGFILISFLFGVVICGRTGDALGEHDHGGIVWDEFVGFWITMIAAPSGWIWIALGFILFRIFDIWKPWPINWADQKVAGGLGVMLDDVIAGVYAALFLQIIYLLM